ncbi:hypothetical protein FDP41_013662 [Naegleria fowleri]|uniref:non-specific serine/threonine protein kinase n=1 Tax=Naegleria fowleri TaxID=5763 RepID=A0A6A5C3K7_NAEFO|nr:uncharacterized protein FDP41_013662 [Naegleria fowleri]KAF0980448.1 hypothetical protein FDP41_013662 [Naegleria fowleri]CAG4714599.1 unnamed protein product [Naegleria fowleri]
MKFKWSSCLGDHNNPSSHTSSSTHQRILSYPPTNGASNGVDHHHVATTTTTANTTSSSHRDPSISSSTPLLQSSSSSSSSHHHKRSKTTSSSSRAPLSNPPHKSIFGSSRKKKNNSSNKSTPTSGNSFSLIGTNNKHYIYKPLKKLSDTSHHDGLIASNSSDVWQIELIEPSELRGIYALKRIKLVDDDDGGANNGDGGGGGGEDDNCCCSCYGSNLLLMRSIKQNQNNKVHHRKSGESSVSSSSSSCSSSSSSSTTITTTTTTNRTGNLHEATRPPSTTAVVSSSSSSRSTTSFNDHHDDQGHTDDHMTTSPLQSSPSTSTTMNEFQSSSSSPPTSSTDPSSSSSSSSSSTTTTTNSLKHSHQNTNITLMDLQHLNIVQYYDTFISQNIAGKFLNILQEFCTTSLQKLFDLKQDIPMNYQIQWTLHIAQALKYIHDECHIIHRDVKPDNILLKKVVLNNNNMNASGSGNTQSPSHSSPQASSMNNKEGSTSPSLQQQSKLIIKLADFDYAKQVDVSNAKTFCGSQEYIAPEIFKYGYYNHHVVQQKKKLHNHVTSSSTMKQSTNGGSFSNNKNTTSSVNTTTSSITNNPSTTSNYFYYTNKVDIWSYGVVVYQLLVPPLKLNHLPKFRDELAKNPNYVKNLLKDYLFEDHDPITVIQGSTSGATSDINNTLDPSSQQNYPENIIINSSLTNQQLYQQCMAQIVTDCLQLDPNQRPDAKDIVRRIEIIYYHTFNKGLSSMQK